MFERGQERSPGARSARTPRPRRSAPGIAAVAAAPGGCGREEPPRSPLAAPLTRKNSMISRRCSLCAESSSAVEAISSAALAFCCTTWSSCWIALFTCAGALVLLLARPVDLQHELRRALDVRHQLRQHLPGLLRDLHARARELARSPPAAACERSASLRTSLATTAKPLPCSPARAASIAALSASRFVCRAISSMIVDLARRSPSSPRPSAATASRPRWASSAALRRDLLGLLRVVGVLLDVRDHLLHRGRDLLHRPRLLARALGHLLGARRELLRARRDVARGGLDVADDLRDLLRHVLHRAVHAARGPRRIEGDTEVARGRSSRRSRRSPAGSPPSGARDHRRDPPHGEREDGRRSAARKRQAPAQLAHEHRVDVVKVDPAADDPAPGVETPRRRRPFAPAVENPGFGQE